ncbi:MAG: hypothetical protein KDA43_02620 [Hyphomonas sp.]|nr:hypothetical protein [Hyphomonas sp.]
MVEVDLRPLTWSGDMYSLCIRRHWNAFFGLATIFEVNRPRMQKMLPVGAGLHILGIHKLCEGAVDYFDSFHHWWLFSRVLCDQYCEFYVLERSPEGNTFATYHNQYLNDRYAVQNLAKRSTGYIGPEKWKLT